SNETRQGKRKVKRKKHSPLKIFLAVFLMLFMVSGVTFAYYIDHLGDKLNSKSQTQAKKVKKGEPINFLLLGVDAGDYTGKDEHQRSDTMMLIRYIPETDNINILSIPRDTKVRVKGRTQKINAAHAIGGPELTIKAVEELLDLEVNYYGSINYNGFKACVDAVGGVDVIVPRDMKYKASDIRINFNKGEEVHLDGKKAEQFVRWRKNNDGTGYALGDVGRAGTQQEFMIKFLEKLKSPEGITKLIPLVNTISDYAETNMSMSMIMSYGKSLIDVNPSTVRKEVLAGEPFYDKEDKTWYYLYDKEKANDYLNIYRGVSSSPSSSGNGNTPLNNENLDISIYNATGVSGLAAEYKERLERLGFNVKKIESYKTKSDKTEIKYNGEEYTISSIKNYLKDVKYTKGGSGKSNEIEIVLGNDSVGGGIMLGSSSVSNNMENKGDGKVDKSSMKIKILNSTSKSGLAGRYKEKLENKGYNVVETGNYSGQLHATQIGYKNNKEFAKQVESSLGTGSVVISKDTSADIVIILGTDTID
ncbi:MAG: LCP family protein, partial [Clostridium sp.]